MTVVSYRNVKRPIIPPGDLPILALFARGEQGAWYDPSDLATMFQDAAGTIPVTGVEQPVGLILDKSGNGNHASQVTTTARPRLSARVNLLTDTDECVSGWSYANVVPEKMPGCVKMVASGDSITSGARISHGYNQHRQLYAVASSVEVKAGTFHHVRLSFSQAASAAGVTLNLVTGEVMVQGAFDYRVIGLEDGWFRIEVARTQEYALHCFALFMTSYSGGADAGYYSPGRAPEPGQYVLMRKPQFQAGRNSAYQWVQSATDYDWQGWPLYLTSDGVDDALSANGAGLAMDRDVGTTLACGYEYGYLSGVTGAANVVSLGHSTSAIVYARLGQRADHHEGRVASAVMRNAAELLPAIATASVARNIKPNTFEVGVVRTRGQTIRHRLRDGAEAVAEFTGDASLATSRIDLFSPGNGVRRIFGALVVMRELDDSEVGRLTKFLTERATRATA